MEERRFVVEREERLDKLLSAWLASSRNQVESLIEKGCVRIEGVVVHKSGHKPKEGQQVEVHFPEPTLLEPREIAFDVAVLYEDAHLLVLDKPPFVTVHDAPSVKESTLVDWLKAKGVSLSTLSGEERHGIVHRLDKETSGAMVVAKTNAAHAHLAEQLKSRSMGRYYLAFIDLPLRESCLVDQPIARHPANRLKMGIVQGGRESRSAFAKLLLSQNGRYELIAAKLFTGRTHQIRAHLAFLQRHILGDRLYGFKSPEGTIPRVFLHAAVLYLLHPATGQPVRFHAPLPADMRRFGEHHFETGAFHATIAPDALVDRFSTVFSGV